MKKINTFYYIALICVFLFVGCSQSKEKQISDIQAYEEKIMLESISKEQADKLIMMYEHYVNSNPKDSLSPVYLYKAAEVAITTHTTSKKAISLLDKIIGNYPKYSELGNCYFLKAYAYDILDKNVVKSKEAYEVFIQKFPEHHLVNDAKALVKNLGMDPLELVRKFEEQNTVDTL